MIDPTIHGEVRAIFDRIEGRDTEKIGVLLCAIWQLAAHKGVNMRDAKGYAEAAYFTRD